MCVVHKIHTIKLFLKSQLNFNFVSCQHQLLHLIVFIEFFFDFFYFIFFISLNSQSNGKSFKMNRYSYNTGEAKHKCVKWFISVECLFGRNWCVNDEKNRFISDYTITKWKWNKLSVLHPTVFMEDELPLCVQCAFDMNANMRMMCIKMCIMQLDAPHKLVNYLDI